MLPLLGLFAVVLVAGLSSCEPGHPPREGHHAGQGHQPAPPQLEALSVEALGGDIPRGAFSAGGQVAVSGDRRDFVLAFGDDVDVEEDGGHEDDPGDTGGTPDDPPDDSGEDTGEVDPEAQAITLVVHSAGMSDLSRLDGRRLTADLGEVDAEGQRSVILSDESGPVYIADAGVDRAFSQALPVSVVTGEVVTELRDDLGAWSFETAVFQTDAGPVELLPGEVETLRIHGVHWRTVVVASYHSLPKEQACGETYDLLSYEMLRVDGPGEADMVERPAELPMAYFGCR
jgi:hypothetical protein